MKARQIGCVLAVTGLLLTACSSADLRISNETQSAQSAQPEATLDTERITAVLSRVQAVVDAADKDLNASALEERLTGSALRTRQAQYALTQATGAQLPPFTASLGSLAVTNSTAWPRVMIDIVSERSDVLPSVFFLVQESPREDYKVASWSRLLGGTSLTLPTVSEGSPTILPDATGLVKTPGEAASAYVEMLNSQTAGNDVFTSDEFSRRFQQDLKSLNDAVSSAGNVTASASVDDKSIIGVQLTDGSALVSVSFTYVMTYQRTVARSTLRLGGTTAAILPGDDDVVKGKVNATYVGNVLMRIPSATTGGPISIIGAERTLESAVSDESTNPDSP